MDSTMDPISDPFMEPTNSTDYCWQDADKLVLGYMLVFVYVNVMLSKMSCVEQRIGLSIVGILRWFCLMISIIGILMISIAGI